jgi:hypothetical protein
MDHDAAHAHSQKMRGAKVDEISEVYQQGPWTNSASLARLCAASAEHEKAEAVRIESAQREANEEPISAPAPAYRTDRDTFRTRSLHLT